MKWKSLERTNEMKKTIVFGIIMTAVLILRSFICDCVVYAFANNMIQNETTVEEVYDLDSVTYWEDIENEEDLVTYWEDVQTAKFVDK